MPATFPAVNLEQRVMCPYNKAHLIPPDRMVVHIHKCKKQYPEIQLKICPFNAKHHVREEDFENHILKCDDKELIEKRMYIDTVNNLNSPPAFSVNYSATSASVSNMTSGEDWDKELYQNNYNPQLAAVDKPVLRRAPLGLGKAGREKWNLQEVRRIERINQGISTKDLLFPNPDGSETSLAELTKDNEDFYNEPLSRFTTRQENISRDIMRVSSSTKPKTRIAANIYSSRDIPPGYDTTSSSSSDGGWQQNSKKKAPRRKAQEPPPEEVKSIFPEFSKGKRRGGARMHAMHGDVVSGISGIKFN